MRLRAGECVMMTLSNPFKPDLRVYKEARSLQKKGYRVVVICWDRDGQYPAIESYDGILVRRIAVRATYGTGVQKFDRLLLFFLHAIREIKKYKFTTIHCHDLDTLPIGVFFKLTSRKKVIYDSHENFSGMVMMSSPHIVSFLVARFERLLLKFVDLVVVASSNFGRELSERSNKPVVVIGNWHDALSLDPARVSSLRKNLLKRHRMLLMYIGGLDKSRSLLPMIRVAGRCREVKFVICGAGYQADAVRDAASVLENVAYLGPIPQREVAYHTAAADALYYVMDYSSAIAAYNAPNSLGYALATGRPIIASANGELGRVVHERQCGVIVKDNSEPALHEALRVCLDRRRLSRMRKNARAAGREFYNWQSMEKRLHEAYHRVRGLD